MVQKLLITTSFYFTLACTQLAYSSEKSTGVLIFRDDAFSVEEVKQENFEKGQRLLTVSDKNGNALQKHVILQPPVEILDLLPIIKSLTLSEQNEISKEIRQLTRFDIRQFAVGVGHKFEADGSKPESPIFEVPFSARIFYQGKILGTLPSDTSSVYGFLQLKASTGCTLDDWLLSCTKDHPVAYKLLIGGEGYYRLKKALIHVAVPALLQKYEGEIIQVIRSQGDRQVP